MREKIVCEACAAVGFAQQFKAITARHLSSQHGMTLDEYVERWPDAPLRGKDDKWIRKAEMPKNVLGIMGELRPIQQEYIIARMKCRTKDAAARMVGIAPSTVYNWKDRERIEQIISYMQFLPVLQAQTIIQDSLPKAAMTMVDLTDSPDDSIAQRASADLLDRGGISRKPDIKIDLNFELWTNEQLDKSITEDLQAMGEIVEGEFKEVG